MNQAFYVMHYSKTIEDYYRNYKNYQYDVLLILSQNSIYYNLMLAI